MIEVYRFEDEQGNGPWFTKDGKASIFSTNTTEKYYKESYLLSCCGSINDLLNYFHIRTGCDELLNNNFKIVAYLVDDPDYIIQSTNHLKFDVRHAHKIGII